MRSRRPTVKFYTVWNEEGGIFKVTTPRRTSVSDVEWVGTLCHELGHAVGVVLGAIREKDQEEEAIAERFAQVLCQEMNWPYDPWRQSLKGYHVREWTQDMEADLEARLDIWRRYLLKGGAGLEYEVVPWITRRMERGMAT